ncbi:MAG: hypothetical protein PHE54_04200 [Bacilli bacterium]|nr:hypothetical protein [Bacilli bacterium]
MREGIGSIFLYNLIIIFLLLIFVFLAGTMSYAKAFRVNSRIINAIENFEGYNEASSEEIVRALTNYGYSIEKSGSCKDKDGYITSERLEDNFTFCVYYKVVNENYLVYGVTSYMYIDLPIIEGLIKIPIYAETDQIYMFSS